MNYLLEKLLISNELISFSREEWISKIIESGIQSAPAVALFEFFSLNYVNSGSRSELNFDRVVSFAENIQEKIFMQISENCYLSNCTLVKFGYNLFHNNVYNFPIKYIGENKQIDRIANTLCDMVANELRNSFENSIVIENLHLSSICRIDCEIDLLFIYKNQIFIFECKRLAFPQNDIKMRNQCKKLENSYKKQLNEEVEKFTSNKSEILNHLRRYYPQILPDKNYIINGYILTKEYTLAHTLKKNSHILHFNQLIECLEEKFRDCIHD